MAGKLKACPFCSCTDIGEVTINTRLEPRHRRFKVYCKACQCRTLGHKTRKGARIYWNTRAQLPSQGGEAVAWMLADAVGGSMLEFQRDLLLENQCRYGGEIVPLYTHPADPGAVAVPIERLQSWVTGLQCGVISQRRVLEELISLLEVKSE